MKIEEIRSLAQIMQETGLTGLEINENGQTIRLEKTCPKPEPVTIVSPVSATAVQAAPAVNGTEEKPAQAENCRIIKSPMVGVFYIAPSPESEPYVKVGSMVKKGDIICVIEAMKLLNEINSDQDGEIVEVCAENGQVVEYGQPLFKLR
ncbi:MAG TPA: acetyl-CoA carboxylase biotin carboxyl carrier protein [Caproiciproducens sp.]|nr:acetyl-CoA carboxylase biotin carboxyl carrier protein [Caproiciproducens sp.]